MIRTAAPPQPPVGRAPLHAVQVLGGASPDPGADLPCAGTVAHVRSLAEGLVARGVRVTVCAAQEAGLDHTFTEVGAAHVAPRGRTEPETVAALRTACADADLVHAHGLRAGLLAALALGRRRRDIPLVVTWHSGTPTGADSGGRRTQRARELLTRVARRRVARAAAVVLGVTTDLVDSARRSGARDARLAPVAIPGPRGTAEPDAPGESAADSAGQRAEDGLHHKMRAEIGAVGRPLVMAVGPLDSGQGHDEALTASRAWRRLDPPPLLAIAGEGPERAALQRRIDDEALPVRLLGRRDDALALLASADLAVLAARWEGRSLLAQEALRAGVPLVAADVGGMRELVGDAAVLVPHGDPDSLSAAVTALLDDPVRREELAAAGPVRATMWPTEDDTVAQVLSVYDELTSTS